jgi:hypothetical protein
MERFVISHRPHEYQEALHELEKHLCNGARVVACMFIPESDFTTAHEVYILDFFGPAL